jgi:phospholipid/cholesterol/gamma-HCH transport system substrate-binding protein
VAREKTSKLVIGIFITGAIIITVIAIIWLGASHYFENGNRYVTYFDESVQGLNPDSTVKYRGVDIGRVERIRVAPDKKLVEVIMKIDLSPENARETYAQLKTAGLTGIVFIDLDRQDHKNMVIQPPLTFEAPYQVIYSRPSTTTQILAGIDVILSKTKDLDLKGISDEVKSVQKALGEFLAGPRTRSIFANVDATSQHLNNTSKNIDRIVAESGIDTILADTKQTISEMRILMTQVRKDLESLHLAETATKAGRMVEGLEKRTREITADIKATTENLRQASNNLDLLVEELQANPSEIIFSKPPPPRVKR